MSITLALQSENRNKLLLQKLKATFISILPLAWFASGASAQVGSMDKVEHFTERKISSKIMPLNEARLFVLALVNNDRAKYNLAPLSLDLIASAAAQKHTDELATAGYCGHWNKAGKKPTQRYTEAGGIHSDSENVICSHGHIISRDKMFIAEELVAMESTFMDEKAPLDGHRINILTPAHNKLGIGLSCHTNSKWDSRLVLAQEFINDYGEYTRLPTSIVRHQAFDVSGVLAPGWTLTGVRIDRDSYPKPMTKDELSKTDSYGNGDFPVAEFYDSDSDSLEIFKIWNKGGRQHFLLRIRPDASWERGLYYVSISAKYSKRDWRIRVSTRTTCLD